jgi:hypothetical protein
MPLDDLAMLANPPVVPADLDQANDAGVEQAEAAESKPATKNKFEECADTSAGRIARRGQDPLEPVS